MTAKQLLKVVENKSLQTIYEDVRKLKDKKLVQSIIYGGVSKSGTMHMIHYLTTRGA